MEVHISKNVCEEEIVLDGRKKKNKIRHKVGCREGEMGFGEIVEHRQEQNTL